MVVIKPTMSRIAVHDGDRQLRRTCIRFGEEVRAIRIRVGVSQAALARAIGISRSVICRMEQGDPDVSPRIRARAAAALGANFRLAIYPDGVPLIHDAAHARLVEAVLPMCDPIWRPTIESPVPGPGRRSTDLRLDRAADVVLIEIESHVQALEAIIREGAEKRAAVAATVGADRLVHVVLALPPTRHHRSLVRAHPGIVAVAFPSSSAAIVEALGDGSATWPGDGILWIPDARPRSEIR
jgi:transcriptional regulator with XRE-family HTH domain